MTDYLVGWWWYNGGITESCSRYSAEQLRIGDFYSDCSFDEGYSVKPGKPNENIVQNHLNIALLKRILVFKR